MMTVPPDLYPVAFMKQCHPIEDRKIKRDTDLLEHSLYAAITWNGQNEFEILSEFDKNFCGYYFNKMIPEEEFTKM